MENVGNVFDQIYKSQFWGSGTSEKPLSGTGSNSEAALPYTRFIGAIILKHNVQSVVDVGHGDWNMWQEYKFENVAYTGLDISPYITEQVAKIHALPNRKFVTSDITKDHHNFEADMLISKDCLQHLSNRDVQLILSSIQKFHLLVLCNDVFVDFDSWRHLVRWHLSPRSRIKSLLNWSNPFCYRNRQNNMDIQAGQFRGLDLLAEPFSSLLTSHRLVEQFDFDGPARSGLKKSVYFFTKKD